MHSRRLLVLAALAALAAFAAPAASAPQDPDEPESEEDAKADAAAELVAAIEAHRAGDYERAERRLSGILEEAPENAEARAWRARVRFDAATFRGALEDADRLLRDDPKHADALLLKSAVLGRRGEAEKALELARAAYGSALDWTARAQAAAILDATGDAEGAKREAQAVVDASTSKEPPSPRERLALGRALEQVGRFVDASAAYRDASEADPNLLDAAVALGDLQFRVYRQSVRDKSGDEYQRVLKRNPDHIGALLGRYRLLRGNFTRDSERAEEALRRVLHLDPANPQALLLRAEMLVDDRRFEEAEAVLERLFRENPRAREARALRIALDGLRNRSAEFERALAADRAERPKSSLLPRTIGVHLKALYRFADAVPYLEEAAARDERDGEARTVLGECLAQLGREKEAVARLQEAEEVEAGFAHPWRENMLEALRALDAEYLDVESPSFRLRHHTDDPVVRETLPAFYEEARRFYGERYGYVPPAKVLVEVLRTFDDFSVRTTGFQGFGALGVCFGPVITSVSPLSEAFRGNFSYLDAAWHEYAHVVHLGLSRSRVPRWFTEGLATLEEKKRNPAFDRNMELELLEARATDTIYPVLELNAAFRGPRIIFGYYQGGLLCEVLEKRSSFAKFREALELFGQDAAMDDVLKKAFGVTGPQLDKDLRVLVDEKLAAVKVRPRLDARTIARLRVAVAADPKNAEAARSLAWAYAKRGNLPDAEWALEKLRAAAPNDAEAFLIRGELALLRKRPDLALEQLEKGFAAGAEEFFSRLQLAGLLAKKKDAEGVKSALRAAIAAFPRFADPKASPHVKLASLLAAEEKLDESTSLLEEFCRISGAAIEPRLTLAERYEARGDQASVARVLDEVLSVDPYRRDVWRRAALANLGLGAFDEAARSARLGRLVAPEREPPGESGRPPAVSPEQDGTQRAELLAIEAEAHLGAKRRGDAERTAREAQGLAAGNERAARVLQRLAAEVSK